MQENERKRVSCGKFCNFCFQNSYLPAQKWMNLILIQLSTTSIKYLNWPNPVFGRFQNGCNKVAIESRVVQFWSEIILVISNWTRTARSVDFEITRMILAQIALHSVQLLLLIRKYLDVWKQISMPWLIKKLRSVGGYWVKIVSFKLVELKFIKTITSFLRHHL